MRAISDAHSHVVDPFAGSDTTLVAAAVTGRRFASCHVGELAVATARACLDAAGATFRFVPDSGER